MAFTEVSWANGDYITETKLDQMVASSVHNREESNYYEIANDASDKVVEASGAGFTSTVSISISSGAITGADITSAGEHVEEIDVSGLSTGIHRIAISISGVTLDNKVFRFYKSPDLAYITIWVTTSTSGGVTVYDTLSNVNIIGHRQAKSWTT